MVFDSSGKPNQVSNVPIQHDGIVPKDELAHTYTFRRRISKKKIEELAIQKYTRCGKGIDFSDVVKEFGCSKAKAQRILKDCCQQRMANDGSSILFRRPKRTLPQQYFPTSTKAKVLQDLIKKQHVPIYPTEVSHSINPLDQLALQTLEDHILPLLPSAPLFIHNIHLKLKIPSECYTELELPSTHGNSGKRHSEVIGNSKVDYIFYPNGTVIVEIRCSNHPFKLQSEEDHSRLLIFFGQLRQALKSFLKDSHERLVPEVMYSELTECDINKDIKVSHWFHYAGSKIQVKHLGHLFSLYVKSMGKDTVYRVEERKGPKKSVIDAINEIFNTTSSPKACFIKSDETLRAEKQTATINNILYSQRIRLIIISSACNNIFTNNRSVGQDRVIDDYSQKSKSANNLKISTQLDISDKSDAKSNDLLFSCYYCDGCQTKNKERYEHHVVNKHPKNVAYPGKADLERLALQPQGKSWAKVDSKK
jgi:hypothetical protein